MGDAPWTPSTEETGSASLVATSPTRQVVVGLILVFAAVHLAWFMPDAVADSAQRPPPPTGPAVLAGAGIGLLSGLTGTGGGIFLSPLLLMAGWAGARHAAGVSAAFILVNSMAALAGHLSGVRFLPPAIPVWAAAAIVGGVLGAGVGSRMLATRSLQRLLAAVLVIAGAKLILTRR